jgi:uncharacterized protein YjbJ (UPF0337 family)
LWYVVSPAEADSLAGALADAAGTAKDAVEEHVEAAREALGAMAHEMAEKAEDVLSRAGIDVDRLKEQVHGAVEDMKHKVRGGMGGGLRLGPGSRSTKAVCCISRH